MDYDDRRIKVKWIRNLWLNMEMNFIFVLSLYMMFFEFWVISWEFCDKCCAWEWTPMMKLPLYPSLILKAPYPSHTLLSFVLIDISINSDFFSIGSFPIEMYRSMDLCIYIDSVLMLPSFSIPFSHLHHSLCKFILPRKISGNLLTPLNLLHARKKGIEGSVLFSPFLSCIFTCPKP